MNDKNLTKFTKDNAKEMGAKGGRASGEARRNNKLVTGLLREVLTAEANDMGTMMLLANFGYGGDSMNAMAVACSLVEKAARGDVKAIRLVLELTGELSRHTNNDNE